MDAIKNLIQSFRKDKLATLFMLLFFMAFFISNSADVLNGFPESWRAPINSICTIIKGGTIMFGIYYSAQTMSNRELESKLETIQAKPDQTVLQSKEIVESSSTLKDIVAVAPTLKTVADNASELQRVIETIPQIQRLVPLADDLAKKAERRD